MSPWLVKLLVAAVAGVVLGIEREAKHKPLGLKTCVVIAVTSCLLTIISIETALIDYSNPAIRSDPMRLSAQIVSGVGFLGAGVILRRNNDVISGLTTAAIVWTASGIGIATGAGYFEEVGAALVILVVSIRFLPFIVSKLGPSTLREKEVNFMVTIDEPKQLEAIITHIKAYVGTLKNMKLNDEGEQIKLSFTSSLGHTEKNMVRYFHMFKNIRGVKYVEMH